MKATLCKYTCAHTSLSFTHAWSHSSVHEYVRLQRRFGRRDLVARSTGGHSAKVVNSLSDFVRVTRMNIYLYVYLRYKREYVAMKTMVSSQHDKNSTNVRDS